MKIKNIVMFFPASLSAFVLKSIKTKIDDDLKQYIENNGMYHFTSKEASEKIIESGMIRASSSLISYGLPASFMFAGIPDVDSYSKNVEGPKNVFYNPEQIRYAVKLNATKNDLANYKVRKYQDGAIVYEGNCILDDEKVEVKQLVLDLIKDKDGKQTIGLRERTKEEIEKSADKYVPSKEFLEVLELERQKRGYHQNNFLFRNDIVSMSNVIDAEVNNSVNGVKGIAKNGIGALKKFISNLTGKNPKLESSIEEQISDNIKKIEQGDIKTKRPVRSDRFIKTIIDLNKNGIKQKSLSDQMETLQKSDEYKYLLKKSVDMYNSGIKKFGIHGISHGNRVAIHAASIVNGENMSLNEKNLDILMTACYLHDIGRIVDVGPHAKRGAKKIAKMNLTTLNGEEYTDEDKRFVQFLVEGHEGDIKRQDKLIKKYKIPEERVELAKKSLAVLRDSDALDRARISNKFNMELNAKYLSTNTAKSLIDFSFGLEGLSKKVNLNKYMESISTRANIESKDTVTHESKEKNEFFQEIGGLVNDDIELYTKNISKEKEKCRDDKRDDKRDDGPGF